MSLNDLIIDHVTGRIREAKVWANVCKASMTGAFLWVIWHGGNSEWLWIAYGGPLLGHESVTRMLNQKDKSNADPATVKP